jgi:hypothetical protein
MNRQKKAESKSKISSLMWHYVEDYDFYRIEYILDGYYHKLQLTGWNVVGDMPTYICNALRAELDCEPEERFYR